MAINSSITKKVDENFKIFLVIILFASLLIISFSLNVYMNKPSLVLTDLKEKELNLDEISYVTTESKIIECRKFSDLTEYCLYENVCLENNNILFLTKKKELENTYFEYNGQINTWDHYEQNNPKKKVLNNPLPFRSFLTGKYVGLSVWNQTSEIHHEGIHSIVAFDFTGHNIFHWAMKVSPLFLFQHYNDINTQKKEFKSIRLVGRQYGDLNDWQRNFLEIATGLKVNTTNFDFTNDPNRKQPILQCYKQLLVPGTAIYIFTGPKEAIDFRQRISNKYNITYEGRRVVIVKRKNRLIVNQDEFESFIKMKVGENLVDVIYLEELSFLQQVEKMSKAAILIGVHGAGLTNAIYLPSTSVIIEITSPHFLYPLYERVSTQSGHLFYRFVTQYDANLHSIYKYINLNARECFKDTNCIQNWKNAPIKVNITKFSIIFEQVMESF